MIVVIGRTTGSASPIARRVAARGSAVELVAPIQPDSTGDRGLAALAAAGVRHAAAPRTAAASLDPADVDLALRYLPDVRVIVVADDASTIAGAAGDAAGWSSASLLVVAERATDAPGTDRSSDTGVGAPEAPTDGASPPVAAVVLQRPASDPDEAFAGFVAALAVRLDGGEEPESAFEAVRRELAVDPVSSSSDRPHRDPVTPDPS